MQTDLHAVLTAQWTTMQKGLFHPFFFTVGYCIMRFKLLIKYSINLGPETYSTVIYTWLCNHVVKFKQPFYKLTMHRNVKLLFWLCDTGAQLTINQACTQQKQNI